MFHLDPPADVTAPSWLTARAHGLRFRWRLARHVWAYRSAPGALELAGLVLGVTSTAWLVKVSGLLGDRVLALPVVVQVIILGSVLVTGGSVAGRRLLRIGKLFESAAADATGGRAARLRQDTRIGMDSDAAFQNLARVYLPMLQRANASILAQGGTRGLQVVTVGGATERPFLVAVLPARDGEQLSDLLNPKLTVRREDREPSFADARQGYMNRLPGRSAAHSRDDESGDNLALEQLDYDHSGHLRLTASVATYGQIVRSCDSLLSEFGVFGFLCADRRPESHGGSPPPPSRWFRTRPGWWGAPLQLTAAQTLRVLPWRATVHSWYDEGRAEDFLLRPGRRAAGLGVALTMIEEGAPGPVAYIGRRGPAVGTYPDAHHVLPAGMCNTKDDFRVVADPRVEPDFLQYTMLTELLEERHSVAELEDCKSDDWRREVRRHCREHEVPMQAPKFTGMAFDLLNLRPEVCAVVAVKRPVGTKAGWKHNWEYVTRQKLSRIDLSQVDATTHNRTTFVQSGAGSLSLAFHA